MNKRKRVATMKHRMKERKREEKRKSERSAPVVEWQKPEEKPRTPRRRTRAAEAGGAQD